MTVVPRPIRALFVAPWGERLGGAEQFLDTLLLHVDPALVRCEVMMLAEGTWRRELEERDTPVTVVPAGRLRHTLRLARTVVAVRRHIQRTKPDIVINWMAKSHLYAGVAAVANRPPPHVLWWQHGISDGHWMDRLATLIPAEVVGCCSDTVARRQAALHPHRAVAVVRPGTSRRTSGTSLEVSRAALGITPDALVVGMVGRLQPWKNQHEIIRAVGNLRDSGRNLHLLLVGGDAHGLSPEYECQLRTLVARLRLGPAVTFTGQVPDARPYYALMNVAVNASRPEPFGIVIIEAMNAGVPVVAVDDGGPREIIVSGEAGGFLVPSERHYDLANAVARLLDDSALRVRLGERGRERAEAVFSAERMARDMERLLLSVAKAT